MMIAFLKPTDQIRIVSPSGAIDLSFIDGSEKVLSSWGLEVTEGQFTRNSFGRFAGTELQRLTDLQEALDDNEVKAILCSRGGYGLAQIIDKLDFSKFSISPKWLIGFSDITVLHNALSNLDFPSVHAIMAKDITQLPEDSEAVHLLRDLLFGQLPEYHLASNKNNRNGIAKGKLIGGNLSVIYGLRGTKFDLPYENNILFIEDIAEKPYHIDRMIQNLRLGGVFTKISGLIVGQFSECEEDSLMNKTIQEIITEAVADYDFPVLYNFPTGHVDDNRPLVNGANVKLEISDSKSSLKYIY